MESSTSSDDDEEDDDSMRPLHDDWFGEPHAPLIFRAVNLENWELCRQLFQRKGDMAIAEHLKHVDPYGYSAVHYASWWSSTPPDLFEQIVKLSPFDVCATPNRKGRTPLHLAAWRGSDTSVIHIAQQRPEAASVADRNQKSPLADACSRNRSRQVIHALLKADHSQVIRENKQGLSPALLFFRISNGFMSASHRSRAEKLQYFAKVRLILAAERRVKLGVADDDLSSDWQLLIATIESPSCPFSFVKVLLDQHQSRIPTYRDDGGNTLLHLAVRAAPFAFKRFFQCDRCHQEPSCTAMGQKACFNRDPDKSHWGVRCQDVSCCLRENNPSIHYVKVPIVMKEQAVVEYILEKYPELASVPNAAGRLPIEVALTVGRTWHSGIRELVQANPNSLSQGDNILGLYPYQMAAQSPGVKRTRSDTDDNSEPAAKKQKCNDHQETAATNDTTTTTTTTATGEDNGSNVEEERSLHQLDTIFNLLRQCPNLLKFAENWTSN